MALKGDRRFPLSEEARTQRSYGQQVDHAKYHDETSRLEKERDDLKEQNTELLRISWNFKRPIVELTDGVESLQKELEKQRRTGGLLRTSLASLQEENESLNTSITELGKEIVSLVMTITRLKEPIGALNKTIARSQEEGSFLNGRVGELGAENQHVKRQNEELRSRVIQLERDMRELRERERATTKRQDIEAHEVVSAQFENLFQR